MVLMRKDVLYECVKRYVMKRKEDPYAFFTPSLRTRKFNFSCCDVGVSYIASLKRRLQTGLCKFAQIFRRIFKVWGNVQT